MAKAQGKVRLGMTLQDRLTQEQGWIYMTGMQALVRLPLQQRQNDSRAGLNTGGFISGYRGSPMGRYDMELWAAEDILKAHNISFRAGINEELAATAIWGSQYVQAQPQATVDGVFAIWYGKGPGVDRAMDPLRHAALAGTSSHGGALVLAGDDHAAKSSTLVNYSDYNFVSAGIPLLYPSNTQELLTFGLHGIAMSRYSGCVIAMKLVTDVVEGGGSVYVAPDLIDIRLPEQASVNILPWAPLLQEQSHYEVRLPAAISYARLNGLNKLMASSTTAKIGIITAGKVYQDVEQGLRNLALAASTNADSIEQNPEINILKLGLIWPLDQQLILDFAQGLETLLIIEEKRPLIEDQVRSALYDAQVRPNIIGKTYPQGGVAFAVHGELSPSDVVRVITKIIREKSTEKDIECHQIEDKQTLIQGKGTARAPTFCAGCPHGRSTQVIEGSRALAGIGCHTMAMLKNPLTTNSVSQMGGEGAMWIGQTDFTDEQHVFTNMGDGTYFHSGILAIRAAVAANVCITYKLLHNGFVSMTGGQPIDGEISAQKMIAQLLAEGVVKISLVTDDPAKFSDYPLPDKVTLHERTALEHVQKQLRELSGVTVLLYDQPCATQSRRLRKRGQWQDPDKRVYINPDICEGCGHCSSISACMAIEPLETELGRKRLINQSSCNKDFSCLEGFCPSFVSVSGLTPPALPTKASPLLTLDMSAVSEPLLPKIQGSYSLLVSGIGGTGVVTIGQTLAVAAHLEGLYSSNLDVTGLAQKYGAVHSHVKIALQPSELHATRIAKQEAQAIIGCDLVVCAGDEALSKIQTRNAKAVVDITVVPTSEFSANPDWQLNFKEQTERIDSVLIDQVVYVDAQAIASALLGNTIYANMILLGASWQQGAIPLSKKAIKRAIELNGVTVDLNLSAFDIGRLVIEDNAKIEQLMQPDIIANKITQPVEQTIVQLIAHRKKLLCEYQNAAYAQRYEQQLQQVIEGVAGLKCTDELVDSVAKYYYKLMAHKDAWEIARLYSEPKFMQLLTATFNAKVKVSFHIGSWPFAKRNRQTGQLQKRQVGPWILKVFALMAKLRFLRNTIFDPFARNEEGKLAALLLAQYESDITLVLEKVTTNNFDSAIELLSLPEKIRGFGVIRVKHVDALVQKRINLRAILLAKGSQDLYIDAAVEVT
ncbi:MAG: indolepyruvate ferredoxin oxidoreductase family protein [Oceanospirillaceae bacterium]|nr:indolepyruvate ferredoxin oxidoreductase family protein [Oceanospirillaceae bacterium]